MGAKLPSSRGKGRRAPMADINVTPLVDVMLVLLIIFMVSAPLMTPGVVDLPTIGQAQRQPDRVIEVIVDADGQLRLKVDGRTPVGSDPDERVAMGRLAARVKALAEGAAQVPVIIAADKGVRYELVVKVMDTLQRAGVARVGLAVRTTGG